jgi:hypothetical protein
LRNLRGLLYNPRMPRSKSLVTEAEIDAFAARLKALVRQASGDRLFAESLRALMGRHGTNGVREVVSRKPIVRTGRDSALEKRVVEAVRGSKDGLTTLELGAKLGAPSPSVKVIAQRLKRRGTFKIVGKRRNAKYQIV